MWTSPLLRGGGAKTGQGHRAVPAGTGTGQDGVWGGLGALRRARTARVSGKGWDRDEPALRGVQGGCLSVRAMLSHQLSSSLHAPLLVTFLTSLYYVSVFSKECFSVFIINFVNGNLISFFHIILPEISGG